jgi:hypothetical protein
LSLDLFFVTVLNIAIYSAEFCIVSFQE